MSTFEDNKDIYNLCHQLAILQGVWKFFHEQWDKKLIQQKKKNVDMPTKMGFQTAATSLISEHRVHWEFSCMLSPLAPKASVFIAHASIRCSV